MQERLTRLGDCCNAMRHVSKFDALLRGQVAGPAEVLRDDVANLDMFSAEEKQQLANSF